MADGLAIDPSTYEIDEVQAVEAGLWKATVRMTLPETYDGVRTAHHLSVTVRFRYPADGSASGLLQTAHEKALETLAAASRATGTQSAAELLTRSWTAIRSPEEED